jgi:hypothetical protein
MIRYIKNLTYNEYYDDWIAELRIDDKYNNDYEIISLGTFGDKNKALTLLNSMVDDLIKFNNLTEIRKFLEMEINANDQ